MNQKTKPKAPKPVKKQIQNVVNKIKTDLGSQLSQALALKSKPRPQELKSLKRSRFK